MNDAQTLAQWQPLLTGLAAFVFLVFLASAASNLKRKEMHTDGWTCCVWPVVTVIYIQFHIEIGWWGKALIGMLTLIVQIELRLHNHETRVTHWFWPNRPRSAKDLL